LSPGASPQTLLGELRAFPQTPFRGPASKGSGGERREGERTRGERRGRGDERRGEEKGGEGGSSSFALGRTIKVGAYDMT